MRQQFYKYYDFFLLLLTNVGLVERSKATNENLAQICNRGSNSIPDKKRRVRSDREVESGTLFFISKVCCCSLATHIDEPVVVDRSQNGQGSLAQ